MISWAPKIQILVAQLKNCLPRTSVCEIDKEIEIAHRAISFLFGIDPGEMG
jgi:hypothetical protein